MGKGEERGGGRKKRMGELTAELSDGIREEECCHVESESEKTSATHLLNHFPGGRRRLDSDSEMNPKRLLLLTSRRRFDKEFWQREAGRVSRCGHAERSGKHYNSRKRKLTLDNLIFSFIAFNPGNQVPKHTLESE